MSIEKKLLNELRNAKIALIHIKETVATGTLRNKLQNQINSIQATIDEAEGK